MTERELTRAAARRLTIIRHAQEMNHQRTKVSALGLGACKHVANIQDMIRGHGKAPDNTKVAADLDRMA